MTKQEFIQHEIHIWGEDHIFDLFDRGFDILPFGNTFRWVRILGSGSQESQVAPLTESNGYASMGKRG